MARTTAVELRDDIDGEPADETVRFALDGAEYDIDLSEDNAEALRAILDRYIDGGRRTGGRKRRPRVIQRPKARAAAPKPAKKKPASQSAKTTATSKAAKNSKASKTSAKSAKPARIQQAKANATKPKKATAKAAKPVPSVTFSAEAK